MTQPLRYTYKTTPYSYQKRALAKLAKVDGRAGLFMPMRTGKTKVSIDWAGIAYHNYGVRRVLIVCPVNMIDVWKSEIEKHCPVPSIVTTLRDTALRNSRRIGDMTVATDVPRGDWCIDWVLVNYEMVWRPVSKTLRLDDILVRWKPDLVIADEAHRLKAPTSRQSKSLAKLGAAARMRLALTGTPVTKNPLDLFGLFRFADPATFDNMTWAEFKDHYADWQPAKYEPRIKEVVRYKNLDELVQRVRAHSFRVKLEECFDMPARQPPVVIHTPLSSAARRIYDEMAKEMIAELGNGKVATAEIVLTKLMRLSQITSGFVKDAEGTEVDIDDAKLRALLSLIESTTEQDEKLVVFCRFKHDYRAISRALTTQGVLHAMLTGETKPRDRTAQIALFQTSPSVPVFISQIQSGSLGIDLSAARLACFYSLDYNWATYVQAQDRILNVRKPRPLGIYHLIAPRTVDVVQLRVLRERGNLAHALIHEPRLLLDDKGDNPLQ